MDLEIWKDVVGFEGEYMVSNIGRIKSLDRTVTLKNHYQIKTRSVKERILRLSKRSNNSPYYIVTLSGRKSLLVHRLVAIAFIPNPLNKPQVNHKNGIKSDNILENLEWVTVKENAIHAIKTGLFRCYSVLTEDQVRVILKSTKRNCELAEEFNVCRSTISKITKRQVWLHI